MNSLLSISLSALTIFLTFLTFIITIFRRPISSNKVTFALFGVSLILWNALHISNLFHQGNKEVIDLLQIFIYSSSIFTMYFAVLFALHFPFFQRRELKLSHYTSFIGGIGYLILIQTICVPVVGEYYPLENHFYTNINHFLVRSYVILALLSFLVIIFYKLTTSIQTLKVFLYRSLALLIILTVIVFFYNYLNNRNYNFLNTELSVDFINIIYITIFAYSLYQFKYIEHYPGILGLFLYGESSILVIEQIAPATKEGGEMLKNGLWRMYEVENWKVYINDFWFNILIDETIDNAVEHGGKRSYDVVTIHVFESSKFLDFYVSDRGKGFEPEKVPDPRLPVRKSIPTGRGIHILKKLFTVSWNFLGNEIRVRVNKTANGNLV